MCELIVVRHGATEWNKIGRQQGHLDSPLSETGIAQAEVIAERLSREKFTALYSSDLGRAYGTAEYIAARTGHEIIAEKRLRERNLGVFQGRTWDEIEEELPEEVAAFRTGDPDYRIPEGESARERYERTVGCIEQIAAQHPGERIVIVAHGGVLDGLFRRALGIDLTEPRRFKLFNASVNTFLVEDGSWKLATWGDICHLGEIGGLDDS
jgi:probable phosphoglycerate mutase